MEPSKSPFHVLAKPIGPICNLDCKYCFYLQKEELFPQTGSFRMKDDVLERFIQQYLEGHPAGTKTVNLAWQGGEPTLMGLDFFQKVIDLQNRYQRPGMRILNSIQTNGTLLTDPWGAFLKEHEFLVGLSIDGPEAVHDYYRVDKKGRGTFDAVMQGLQVLKKYQVEFNTLTCVHRKNSYRGKEVYQFLKEIGATFLQFIPIVERTSDGGVTERSVESKQYGRFMNKVFDEWLNRRDVGRIYIQDFDNLLGQVMGLPSSICIKAETCGRAVALEHNGNLYSCDHFVNPEDYLGNIAKISLSEMLDSEQQIKFGQDKSDTLPRYCRECRFLKVCNGGCPKDRIIDTPQGDPGLNYLCEGFQLFYAHTLPTFRAMAECLRQGRPAKDFQLVRESTAHPQPA